MAAYKFPGRITFDEIKKPPNTGVKAPKERYSTQPHSKSPSPNRKEEQPGRTVIVRHPDPPSR